MHTPGVLEFQYFAGEDDLGIIISFTSATYFTLLYLFSSVLLYLLAASFVAIYGIYLRTKHSFKHSEIFVELAFWLGLPLSKGTAIGFVKKNYCCTLVGG